MIECATREGRQRERERDRGAETHTRLAVSRETSTVVGETLSHGRLRNSTRSRVYLRARTRSISLSVSRLRDDVMRRRVISVSDVPDTLSTSAQSWRKMAPLAGVKLLKTDTSLMIPGKGLTVVNYVQEGAGVELAQTPQAYERSIELSRAPRHPRHSGY